MRGNKKRRTSYPVITSLCVLHTLDHSEMFMELYREEKREDGDRGGQEDKGVNQKERQFEPVINSLCVLHSLEPSERFMELHKEEKREEGDRGDQEKKRGNQKERDSSSQESVP